MELVNFYKGYEGNPEIIIKEKENNNSVYEVRLLEHHFNELLSLFPLGKYHHESILYNYFVAEGWHDGEWECKRIEEFLNQLNMIENLVPDVLKDIYLAIKKIVQSTLHRNNSLFIELT